MNSVFKKATYENNTRLLNTLAETARGRAWLQVLPKECIAALDYIDDKLSFEWGKSLVCPSKTRTLLPFHMIAPEEVKLVVLCKEPYSSISMATGIPVEAGGKLDTYSERIFMELISEYWKGIDKHNYMRCYYASGILVINSSFTASTNTDKRYPLSTSHFPLWTRFCQPFIKHINLMNIHTLGLGVESKGLMRNLANGAFLHTCVFPTNYKSTEEFKSTLRHLIDSLIFSKELQSSKEQ